MLISTRGRYALRMMISIALSRDAKAVSLKTISDHEDISMKYLEQLARSLVNAGLLTSTRGKNGGYSLTRDPKDIGAGEIIRAAEGDVAAVACLAIDGIDCPRESICTTVDFWRGLDSVIDTYIDSYTLDDFLAAKITV